MHYCLVDGLIVTQMIGSKQNLAQIADQFQQEGFVVICPIGNKGARLSQLVARVAAQKSGGSENSCYNTVETRSTTSATPHISRIRSQELTGDIRAVVCL